MKGKDYIVGYLTLADIYMAQIAEILNYIDPKILKNYKNVNAIVNRVNNLESVKAYVKSKYYTKAFLPPICKFGACNPDDIKAFVKIHSE